MSTKAELAKEKMIAAEKEVVELLVRAAEIATEYFGKPEPYAVEEIHHYLEMVEEKAFLDDLKRLSGYAKTVYKTDAPTAEMVFGIFDVFGFGDDEDEE